MQEPGKSKLKKFKCIYDFGHNTAVSVGTRTGHKYKISPLLCGE